MDKLEKVLAAEEAARHVVADAASTADEIRSHGRAQASEIAREIADAAAAKAASERDETIGRAQAEAEDIAARGAVERKSALEGAGLRTDAAVRAVVDALKG